MMKLFTVTFPATSFRLEHLSQRLLLRVRSFGRVGAFCGAFGWAGSFGVCGALSWAGAFCGTFGIYGAGFG